MKKFTLNVYGIKVVLTEDGKGGSICSDLKEPNAKEYNIAMDAIESLILSHAIAGIDIASPAYIEGLETTVQACANHY